jgi:hypothetical protein
MRRRRARTASSAGSLSLRRRSGRHRLQPSIESQKRIGMRRITAGSSRWGSPTIAEDVRVVPCRAPSAAAAAPWSVQPSQKMQALRGWSGSRGPVNPIQDPVRCHRRRGRWSHPSPGRPACSRHEWEVEGFRRRGPAGTSVFPERNPEAVSMCSLSQRAAPMCCFRDAC